MKSRKNRKRLITALVSILFVLLGVLLFLCRDDDYGQEDVSIQIGEDLEITRVESYSGRFVEDGSDEEVSDVMMIVIKNNGEQTLQYAELELICEDKLAEFAFSTLPPGKEMIILEKNRRNCLQDVEKAEIKLKNVVFFNEELNIHESTFSIEALEGALNVKNISEKDIAGQIAIYYKSVKGNSYYGGITYRVVIRDGLKSGEIQQIMTNHFLPDTSEVMFVTYVP